MFAYVENGIVKEICRNESPFNIFFPDYANKFLPCPDSVEVGYTYDGAVWAPPSVDRLGQLKAERQAAVDAITVTVDGLTFDGDETSQTRMARAIVVMQAASIPTISWVLHDNTVATVTVTQLTQALAAAGAEQARLWVLPYEAVSA